MQITPKAKWIAAVSVLSLGVTLGGGAFAYPGKHLNNAAPPAVTQQTYQDFANSAGSVHQPDNQNLADSQQHQSMATSPVSNEQQLQATAPVASIAPTHNTAQAKMVQTGNNSGNGYQYGHTAQNQKVMHGNNHNTHSNGGHGTMGHE